MIKNVLKWMDGSAYMGRLAMTFPMFVFVLILQMFLCVHLLAESMAMQFSAMAILKIGASTTFRSSFWASLAWFLFACPKSKRGQNLLGFILVLFFAILHILESYLLGKYGEGYTFSVVTILMATTAAESREYLATSLSFGDFIRGLIELVISLIVVLLLSQISEKLKRSRTFYLVIFLIGLGSLVNLFVFMPRIYTHSMDGGIAPDNTISPVDRLIWNTGLVYIESVKIKENADKIKKIDLGHLEVKQPYGQINVVVVIGESLRRDYMHCYGYTLENTPKLDSLIADGSMIAYSDIISPAAGTVESLTQVLTYLSLDVKGAWYDYPNLTNVLSRGGYESCWVSNQEITGDYVQPLNVIARMSNTVRYVKMRTPASDWAPIDDVGYDMEILPYLRNYDPKKKISVAQFVHLIGSHVDYAQRYPKSYARFSSKDIVEVGDKARIADYVNSVYYNDAVITSIIKHYQDQKTLLFYFSDHGESLFDAPNNPNFFGHGLALKSNVEIPFIVYVSPQLRKEHPELYERLVRYKDRPLVNDLFTNSLLGLLGITSKYSNPKLEFFSEGYDATRPRIPVNMKHRFSYDDAP